MKPSQAKVHFSQGENPNAPFVEEIKIELTIKVDSNGQPSLTCTVPQGDTGQGESVVNTSKALGFHAAMLYQAICDLTTSYKKFCESAALHSDLSSPSRNN